MRMSDREMSLVIEARNGSKSAMNDLRDVLYDDLVEVIVNELGSGKKVDAIIRNVFKKAKTEIAALRYPYEFEGMILNLTREECSRYARGKKKDGRVSTRATTINPGYGTPYPAPAPSQGTDGYVTYHDGFVEKGTVAPYAKVNDQQYDRPAPGMNMAGQNAYAPVPPYPVQGNDYRPQEQPFPSYGSPVDEEAESHTIPYVPSKFKNQPAVPRQEYRQPLPAQEPVPYAAPAAPAMQESDHQQRYAQPVDAGAFAQQNVPFAAPATQEAAPIAPAQEEPPVVPIEPQRYAQPVDVDHFDQVGNVPFAQPVPMAQPAPVDAAPTAPVQEFLVEPQMPDRCPPEAASANVGAYVYPPAPAAETPAPAAEPQREAISVGELVYKPQPAPEPPIPAEPVVEQPAPEPPIPAEPVVEESKPVIPTPASGSTVTDHVPKVGLLVCTKGENAGNNFSLIAGENRIGVTDACDIRISDDTLPADLSFVIYYNEKREIFSLQPPTTSALLLLNNERVISAIFLKPHDAIRIGKSEFLLVPFQ